MQNNYYNPSILQEQSRTTNNYDSKLNRKMATCQAVYQLGLFTCLLAK